MLGKTDAHLAALPVDQRLALEKLLEQILAAAPDAEEHFAHGMPGQVQRPSIHLFRGGQEALCTSCMRPFGIR